VSGPYLSAEARARVRRRQIMRDVGGWTRLAVAGLLALAILAGCLAGGTWIVKHVWGSP
jgi:hypothetical protein